MVWHPPQNLLYTTLGWIAFGLGMAGVFLPLLPTFPFILLAAFFFARGSPRAHGWLRQHPWFGQALRDWEAGRGLTAENKARALGLMWVVMLATALLIAKELWIKGVLLGIAGAVTAYLLFRVPTYRK